MRETLIDFMEAARRFDVLFVTTNSTVAITKAASASPRVPKAVMGAGVAEIARVNFPGIDEVLARKLRLWGNVPLKLGYYQAGGSFYDTDVRPTPGLGKYCEIWSFPTKHAVSEDCLLSLIVQSAKLASWEMGTKDRFASFALPRPGCGVGGLDWAEVKAHLDLILDGRFYAIDRPPKS